MAQAPSGGKWIKARDLIGGETAKIVTEAQWEKSTYNGKEVNQFVCDIEIGGEQRKLKLTMASCKELVSEWGRDTLTWVGKMVRMEAVKIMSGGEIRQSILVLPLSKATKEEKTAWED